MIPLRPNKSKLQAPAPAQGSGGGKPKPEMGDAVRGQAKYGAPPVGGGATGGGGASGKMLYRPKVSQSRISVLLAQLGMPFLKRPQ